MFFLASRTYFRKNRFVGCPWILKLQVSAMISIQMLQTAFWRLSQLQPQLYHKDTAWYMDSSDLIVGGNFGLIQRWGWTKNGQHTNMEGSLYCQIVTAAIPCVRENNWYIDFDLTIFTTWPGFRGDPHFDKHRIKTEIITTKLL